MGWVVNAQQLYLQERDPVRTARLSEPHYFSPRKKSDWLTEHAKTVQHSASQSFLFADSLRPRIITTDPHIHFQVNMKCPYDRWGRAVA
jgi:hypothetical protein